MGIYELRLGEEFASAPPQFKQSFQFLEDGDLKQAAQEFAGLATARGIDSGWTANAVACAAYCEAELGNFQNAVHLASLAKNQEFQFTTFGGYYYHSALFKAHNQLDNLSEALSIAAEAIQFFISQGSPGNVAFNLGRKANILKQMASHLSMSGRFPEARERIVEAIRAICDSFVCSTEGWQEEIVDEEMKALHRIAARVGVTRRDLGFLDSMPEINFIVDKYFGENLTRVVVSNLRNNAIQSISEGNRAEAVERFREALALAPEVSEEDRAFKALLLYYQCGVCILKMHGLENRRPGVNNTREQQSAVGEIQQLWRQTVRLCDTLSPNFLAAWDRRCPPGLQAAVRAIARDPVMQSSFASGSGCPHCGQPHKPDDVFCAATGRRIRG